MGQTHHDLQHYREVWHTPNDVAPGDPLAVQLSGPPSYLPLLQQKGGYASSGLRMQRHSVLGLSDGGQWVEDRKASGQISHVYGSSQACFGEAPFGLFPLQEACGLYPNVAHLIWNEEEAQQIENSFLAQWHVFLEDSQSRLLPDPVSAAHRRYSNPELALGRLETPATCAALTAALSSPDSGIRSRGVSGLAQTTPARGFRQSVMPLIDDADGEVRQRVARALGAIGTVDSLPALYRLLNDLPRIQVSAIHALVALGLPQSRSVIFSIAVGEEHGFESPEISVQAQAVLALQTFWEPSDGEACRRLLGHSRAPVRAAAAWDLGAMGVISAVGDVYQALWDSEPAVRVAAAYALMKLGDERGMARIQELASQRVAHPYMDEIAGNWEIETTLLQFLLFDWSKKGSHAAEQAVQAIKSIPNP